MPFAFSAADSLFALVATDKPDSTALRASTRPAHLSFLQDLDRDERLLFAGPFLNGDGKPCGSLVVVKADSLAAAEALLAQDPYQTAGLFADTRVQAWAWAVNKPDAA